ncbi:Formamidopyrimidine-DNA glycosylase 1 [compost metagenome]
MPQRRLESLSGEELVRLFHAMRSTLSEAASHGGYMDVPLFKGDTLTGSFDSLCRVYDREGETCVRCGAVIARVDFVSKKSFSCPGCQH